MIGGWDIGWNGVEWTYFYIILAIVLFFVVKVILYFIKSKVNEKELNTHGYYVLNEDDDK